MTPDGWFLLGAPWDSSGSARGEQAAPHALRAAGLSGLASDDVGDAPIRIDSRDRDQQTGVRALHQTIRASHGLADALVEAMRDQPGRRPLVVGGDCSILLGVFPALRTQIGPACLWFVDGHPDFLDGQGSQTGETADMDLAILTGHGAQPLVALSGTPPMVPADAVVLLGHRTRNLDEDSAAELARLPPELRRIDAATVEGDPAGAGHVAAEWLTHTGDSAWLHLDLDVLDPRALPAVTYPQSGGLDWSQLARLLKPLARSPHLFGVSVADFRPDKDPARTLAVRTVELLERTLP